MIRIFPKKITHKCSRETYVQMNSLHPQFIKVQRYTSASEHPTQRNRRRPRRPARRIGYIFWHTCYHHRTGTLFYYKNLIFYDSIKP